MYLGTLIENDLHYSKLKWNCEDRQSSADVYILMEGMMLLDIGYQYSFLCFGHISSHTLVCTKLCIIGVGCVGMESSRDLVVESATADAK